MGKKIRVSKNQYDAHILAEAKKIQRKEMYLGGIMPLAEAKKKAAPIVAARYELNTK